MFSYDICLDMHRLDSRRSMDVMLKKLTVEGFRSFHNKVTLDFSHPHDYE